MHRNTPGGALNRPILAMLLLTACGGRGGANLENQLESEVIALNQTVRRLKIEATNCAETGGGEDTIYSDLKQIFAGTEVDVSLDRGATMLNIPVDHLFADAYSLRFRDEATMTLDLLATALNLHPKHDVVVEGHTNDKLLPSNLVRRYGSHLDLSFQYAAAVMERLSKDFRVDEARFTVSARGPWAPIASNDVTSGQARNQRVTVKIYRGPTL